MFGQNGKKPNAGSKVFSKLNPFGKPATIAPTAPVQQPVAQPVTPAANDAKASMLAFMKEQGLFDGIDMTGFTEAVRGGDAAKAAEIFSSALQNTVSVAMIGAQRISAASVERAVAQASTQAVDTTTRNLALRELTTQLPFAADPAVAPVVEGIFDAFVEQGQDMATAIDNTNKYFEEQARSMGKHYGMMERPTGDTRPGSRGFSDLRGQMIDGQNYNSGDDDEAYDFVAAFTSGQQTFDELNAPPTVRIDSNASGGAGGTGDGSAAA